MIRWNCRRVGASATLKVCSGELKVREGRETELVAALPNKW